MWILELLVPAWKLLVLKAESLLVLLAVWCMTLGPCDAHLERACDGSVGAFPTPKLAQLLGAVWSVDSEDKDWLACVEAGKGNCGRKTLSVSGVYSALPRRFHVSADIVRGIVKSCTVSGTAGW
jgi:hypothetical protein